MCHLKLLRTERVLLSSVITRNEGVVLNIHKNRIRVFEHHYVILKSKKNSDPLRSTYLWGESKT